MGYHFFSCALVIFAASSTYMCGALNLVGIPPYYNDYEEHDYKDDTENRGRHENNFALTARDYLLKSHKEHCISQRIDFFASVTNLGLGFTAAVTECPEAGNYHNMRCSAAVVEVGRASVAFVTEARLVVEACNEDALVMKCGTTRLAVTEALFGLGHSVPDLWLKCGVEAEIRTQTCLYDTIKVALLGAKHLFTFLYVSEMALCKLPGAKNKDVDHRCNHLILDFISLFSFTMSGALSGLSGCQPTIGDIGMACAAGISEAVGYSSNLLGGLNELDVCGAEEKESPGYEEREERVLEQKREANQARKSLSNVIGQNQVEGLAGDVPGGPASKKTTPSGALTVSKKAQSAPSAGAVRNNAQSAPGAGAVSKNAPGAGAVSKNAPGAGAVSKNAPGAGAVSKKAQSAAGGRNVAQQQNLD